MINTDRFVVSSVYGSVFSNLENQLFSAVARAIHSFPKLFDPRLSRGLLRLLSNTDNDFIQTRSLFHLYRLLLTQFTFQKRIEAALQSDSPKERHIFLRIFYECPNHLCVALALRLSHGEEQFRRHQLLNILHSHFLGIKEIPSSFYSWTHPELPYLFCYLEVQKLRGKNLSFSEIRNIEKSLKEQLAHSITPLTPGVFYPYNEEESYRQLLLLQKEMHHLKDLPNVSIYFREQTPYLARIFSPSRTH